MAEAGTQKAKVAVMNFSGAYEKQEFHREFDTVWLDCRDIQGTNCYCDEAAEAQIQERIGQMGPAGIHFLDSGNYHYLSKLWLDRVEEPFELVVLDNHTDMQPPMFGDILSCGGWVKRALDTNRFLQRVLLIGPPETACREPELAEYGGRVAWVSREELRESADGAAGSRGARECIGGGMGSRGARECIGGGTGSRGARERIGGGTGSRGARERTDGGDWAGMSWERADCLGSRAGLPLYISVDKDVLSPDDAATNWDQGEMKLGRLLEILGALAEGRRVIGCDICGEDPERMEDPDCTAVNDRGNEKICRAMMEFFG